MQLEILICTIGQGINNVPDIILPPIHEITYLISWQPIGVPAESIPKRLLQRADIRIVTTNRSGLCANRNNAFSEAQGDILLISDDDTRYTPVFFQNILTTFEEHPEADIIHFQALDEDGHLMKKYATKSFTYESRPRFTFFTSFEIACRRSNKLPPFDERFGLGSPFLACGEEEVFLHTAYRKGLKIRYEPLPVVQTDSRTTGTLFATSPAVQRSKGAVLYYIYGFTGAVLRCIKFALTRSSLKAGIKSFTNMWHGIRYIQKSNCQ